MFREEAKQCVLFIYLFTLYTFSIHYTTLLLCGSEHWAIRAKHKTRTEAAQTKFMRKNSLHGS
jgi:hypothetical protein